MTDFPSSTIDNGVLAHIRAKGSALSAAERRVSDVVSSRPRDVVQMTVHQLAEEARVSDATVLRFCRAIGFDGYTDMRLSLVADSMTPKSVPAAPVNQGDDIRVIFEKVFTTNIQLLTDALATLDDLAFSRAVDMLANARWVVVFGVGTSSPWAQALRDRLIRVGILAHSVTDAYLQSVYADSLSGDDVLIAISQSGRPPTLLDTVQEAQARGAKVMAITSDQKSPLAKTADLVLLASTRHDHSDLIPSPIVTTSLLESLYMALAFQDADRIRAQEDRIQATWQRWQDWRRTGESNT